MRLLLFVVAAALAFLAGFLAHYVPLWACVVAWLCGLASGIWLMLLGVNVALREDFIRWQHTGRG